MYDEVEGVLDIHPHCLHVFLAIVSSKLCRHLLSRNQKFFELAVQDFAAHWRKASPTLQTAH